MPVSSPLVQSRAQTALRQSPIPPLRKLTVEESDATVIILGMVGSYYLKQLAQETVMPVLDGRELLNRVAVVRHGAAVAAATER
jgi:Asp/Glu/hydantoin racemase